METKQCQNCKQNFVIESEDFNFYEKIKVPPPTFCPECRRQRRFAWRNYVNFYHRKSALTGKNILSIYSPELNIQVFSPKEWYTDKWNPFDYGVDYDFSRSFFEQYSNLLRRVPRLAMDNDDGILSKNCEYTNDFLMGKNCYLVVKAWKLENVMYSYYVVNSKDLVDVNTSFGNDEGNYETINTQQCYRCKFIIDCRGCIECDFSVDLRNCNSCLLCSGLRNKSFCYKNQEVGREKYEEILKIYNLQKYSGFQKAKEEFEVLYKKHPKKPLRMINCNNCLGDLLINSKNCKYCFCVLKSENSRYCTFADGVRDSLDADASGGSELTYECDLCDFSSRVIGSYFSGHCQDSYYLNLVSRSKDCFGCVGLKDAQYCILNKQYTKKEYFEMIEKIKKHMIDMPYIDKVGRKYIFGDFPPIELSYFGYNDTIANDLYPLSEKEIKENNYPFQFVKYHDFVKGAISSDELPDNIEDVKDDILEKIFFSSKTNIQYRITKDELNFYRKYKIPLPRESFYERYERRFKLTTSFKLYKSKSNKSGKSIITCYNPKDNYTVLTDDEYKAQFE